VREKDGLWGLAQLRWVLRRGRRQQDSSTEVRRGVPEVARAFNRRDKSDLFVDTLRHMVTAPVLTFERLTA
jgi:hypothetical protein